MPVSSIKSFRRLQFPWTTEDPFLFCAHHFDRYPASNGQFGPGTSLAGRTPGDDFIVRDGFRMYHGLAVPGFPRHPHRGFETVTFVTRGLVDHSDSMGASGRYGDGDVQWMTAGRGMQHAEMFPLLHNDAANPLELFQIWLNLPGSDKMTAPGYRMLWREDIQTASTTDDSGRVTRVTLVTGDANGLASPPPPPQSWASRAENEIRIWLIEMPPEACFSIPASSSGLSRTLYFFEGDTMRIETVEFPFDHAATLDSSSSQRLINGASPARLLLLQGRPIGEPVVQYGPFVMNTHKEIEEAFADYRRTSFGDWPWTSDDPVHGDAPTRFARFPDGRVERGR